MSDSIKVEVEIEVGQTRVRICAPAGTSLSGLTPEKAIELAEAMFNRFHIKLP